MTRLRIIKTAARIASRDGLNAVTIGQIAALTGMSKSGLFGHFQSKERLQSEIIELVTQRLSDKVFRPAVKMPRGEPRIQAIYGNWKNWIRGDREQPGGCILIAASCEVDDHPGKLQKIIRQRQAQIISSLEKATCIAIEEGHFAATLDVSFFSWEWFSLMIGYHFYCRLLEHPQADALADQSFKSLLTRARRTS